MEDEMRKVIAILKTTESPDMDGITAEIIKAGDETIVQWTCGLCNQIWDYGIVPVDWKDRVVVGIPKMKLS